MAINLQIVGIFFGCTVSFSNGQDQQLIADVLAAANQAAEFGKIPNVSAFNYETSNPPKRALISVAATYTGEVKGRGVGDSYPPGEYSLTEDLSDRPAYSVWQYYVFDANNVPIARGVKYLDDQSATVPEGGTVIFRLVSILAGPNPRSKIVASRQA